MSQQGNITALSDPSGAANDAAFLGSTSAPPTLAFKPGVTFANHGPVRQNVFTSPNSSGTDGLVLLQDILQGEGFFPTVPVFSSQLEFDFSSNADAFTLTANLNLGTNCTVKGLVNQANDAVPTLNTSTFTIVPLLEIKSLNVVAQATSGSTFTATPGSITFSGQTTVTSTGFPLYAVASGTSVTVLRDTATLGNGTHPVVNVTGGTLNIIMFDGSALEAGAINRTGGAVVIDSYSPGASIDSSYVGAAGFTINLHYSSSGAYSPAVPANWSPDPTLVTGALDQIAAQIHITPGILVLGGTTNITDSSVGSIVAGSSSHASNVSVAMGNTAVATGNHSVAIGPGNTSTSVAGVAIGDTNTSEGGSGSVAIGGVSTANGVGVVAIGTACDATTIGSVAIGNTNSATDNGTGGALAIGSTNTVTGDGSVAAGYDNTITNNSGGSVAIGFENDANNIDGGPSIAIGANNVSYNESVAIGTNNTINSGTYGGSVAIGQTNTSTNEGCVAIGKAQQAGSSGNGAVAIGSGSTGFQVASDQGSVAIGYANTASSDASVAIGDSNTAGATGGIGTVAIGYTNTADSGSGNGEVAIGYQNSSSGDGAVAIGDTNATSGQGAVAIGRETSAGEASVAIGLFSTATVINSVAIGSATAAVADDVAIGTGATTQAGANPSVAIGSSAIAVNAGVTIGSANTVTSGGGSGDICIGTDIQVSDAGVGGTVGIGSVITATGDGSVAIGSSCEALTNGGPGNIALGSSVVSQDSGSGGAVAIGTNVGALGNGAVAIGLNVNVENDSAGALAVGEYCTATTYGSLALGYNCNTTGSIVGGSVALGYECVANDASGNLGNGGGVAIGYFCEAGGSIGVAIGSGCFAQGQDAPGGPGPGGIAIGSNNTADSEASIVTGENGSSYFVGESVHHSGNPGLAPTPQTTADRDLRMIPMSGNLAAGSAPGSTLVLTLTDGSSQFDLNRFSTTAPGGATLAIRVECTVDVAYGDPTQISAWFKQTALVRTGASSAPILVGTDTQTSIKDAGAATWTMTLGLSGDVFTVTLSNGSATNGFSATARLTYDPNPNFYV
jgi:hypothetical protein